MNYRDLSQWNLRQVQEALEDWAKQINRVNRGVQQQVDSGVNQAWVVSHRVALTWIGFGGLAYDTAKAGVRQGRQLLDKAEDKGERIEHEFSQQVGDQMHRLEEQAAAELRRLRSLWRGGNAGSNGSPEAKATAKPVKAGMPD